MEELHEPFVRSDEDGVLVLRCNCGWHTYPPPGIDGSVRENWTVRDLVVHTNRHLTEVLL